MPLEAICDFALSKHRKTKIWTHSARFAFYDKSLCRVAIKITILIAVKVKVLSSVFSRDLSLVLSVLSENWVQQFFYFLKGPI